MADWFETRFRDPVDAGQLDPAFVARMRAVVVEEWQADAGAIPVVGSESDPDDREGDMMMLETEDRPTGHEPANSRRRGPGRWLLVAAAAAVVAVVGTVLVTVGNDEDPVDTVPSATTAPAPAQGQDIMVVEGSDLEPGRYFIDPDADDSTPLRVTYEVAEEGWEPWFGAMKSSAVGHAAVSIVTVPNLVTDGCRDHSPLDPPVGSSVDDLATALSGLAPFEVTEPPTDVTLSGYSGKHLQLTVPFDQPVNSGAENFHDFTGCADGEIHSWISTHNEGPFFGYEAPGYREDFWILDVDGTRLVLVQGATPGTPVEDLNELGALFDSIRIEP